ncbi:MAG: ribbon-helix-helix domain-containing protein [Alphaproteobacteria bacterium]|nr:ribbon-helix-helix domain-containing protein [Alphaproteobacteria bacterium]
MKKISLSLSGHQTSISLEPEFIDALQYISKLTRQPIAKIIDEIDENRDINTNLSSAVRIWILKYFRK